MWMRMRATPFGELAQTICAEFARPSWDSRKKQEGQQPQDVLTGKPTAERT